jgi:uncharacterized protein
MSNPKTVPSCSKPEVQNGWIRKSDLDAWLDRYLPVPTQVISNEEYRPIPPTPQQRLLEQEIVAGAERQACSLGMDRRQFLRTSCGMALAFAAMNSVFGRFFRVEAAELFEPGAVAENKARFFIFDVQTHHVAMPNQAPRADPEFLKAVVGMRDMARRMNPALKEQEARIEDAYLGNYIKEIFLDSDTDMVALSALPGTSEETDVLTPEVIYKSRTWINELTSSPRVISHGYFSPDLGQQNLEYMHAQTEKLKIDAWKGYSGVARAKGKQGWRLDDEKLAIPARRRSRTSACIRACRSPVTSSGGTRWTSPMRPKIFPISISWFITLGSRDWRTHSLPRKTNSQKPAISPGFQISAAGKRRTLK